MGIKDVIDNVKKPTTLFFDGEYYSSVDELLDACNISRNDYTQVKAAHRDWDAMNVVDFLVKTNKGVLPSKNSVRKTKLEAEAAEKAAKDAEEKAAKEAKEAEKDEYVPKFSETRDFSKPQVEETPAPVVEEVKEEAPAPVVEEVKEEAPAPVVEEVKEEETPAPIVEEVKEEAPAPVVEEVKEEAPVVEEVKEEAVEPTPSEEPENVKEEEKTTMSEYDFTPISDAAKAAKPAPAPSGSTAKAFDELLVNLNISKEGFMVAKQVQADMSDLDVVNAILTTKGNPVSETSKDFDELLANLNTPKIGFQLVKQIHADWSDLDVINAIIKSK